MMHGGSLSSRAVMNLVQNNCATSATETANMKVNFLYKDVVNSYGSVYRMTGGSGSRSRSRSRSVNKESIQQPEKLDDSVWSKFTMTNANLFLRKVVNNRILDLYLKYLGITLLTPATLVPIALFMGQRTFTKVLSDIKSNDSLLQTGGSGFLDKPNIPLISEIPILDDEIMGNLLKISGLFALGSISPYTLIPVGLLMALYERYGEDVLKIPEYISEKSLSKSQVAGKLRRRHRQRGGSREPWPNMIPENILQNAENIFTGQSHTFNRGAVFNNREMQVTQHGLPSQLLGLNVPFANTPDIAGLPGCGANPNLPSTHCRGLAAAMAGGSRSRSRKQNKKRTTRNCRKMRGGGSDWKGSLYALGPTNTVDMPSAQYKAFSHTTQQIPNSVLNGGNTGTSNFYNYDSYRNVNNYTPLYTQGVTGKIPQSNIEVGSCGSGVPVRL